MEREELERLRNWLQRQGVQMHVTPADTAPAHLPPDGAGLRLNDGLVLQFEATGPAPLDAPAPEVEYRQLAEHSGDLIVAVDANLVLRYASPAAEGVLGWAPGDLIGRSLADLLVPEECASFIARHFTQAARHGSGPDLFRLRTRSGAVQWVEARVSPLPPGSRLGSYVVTLRDATRRHQAEQALAAANHELAELATTDALTGLPNRRQFDATLRKEWFRGLRDGLPLGLLMIDIDHFKRLNDHHGHPVGDAVLARVAQIIREQVHRAGDMAARYGGEEFVVVLPGTAEAGALEIAEHIRQAAAAADFSPQVGAACRLSLSVGVACAVPRAGHAAESLVQAADAALYDAKRLGRNRVALAR